MFINKHTIFVVSIFTVILAGVLDYLFVFSQQKVDILMYFNCGTITFGSIVCFSVSLYELIKEKIYG